MTVIISHPDCLLHNADIQHPECPERLKVITKALASSELRTNLTYQEALLGDLSVRLCDRAHLIL